MLSLAILKEQQDEQQQDISGHRPNSTTSSDSNSLLFPMHFPFDDDDDSISLSYPSQQEDFLQDEEKNEEEVRIHSSSSFSGRRTPPSPPPTARVTSKEDDLCVIVSENHDDEGTTEGTLSSTLLLEDDNHHDLLLQPHTDRTQEERSPVSLFEEIQAEEDNEGKEDQAMMIMPPVGDIIFFDEDDHSIETPHDTDGDDRMRRNLMVTPPIGSAERPSVLYNVPTSIISASSSSYNSTDSTAISMNSSAASLHHDEESSSCILQSKKDVPSVPSFLIDQRSSQSYFTTSTCSSRLLQSMKRTIRTQDLIRKEKKKIKLHDSFVDKDVLQELMYCMQDSKKSREKLRQFLVGKHSGAGGGRSTTIRRYY